jgi:hypothetical protein
MKMNVYSIFDTASGAYMRPFFMAADNAAVRAFCDLANDSEHEVGRHPKDYILCRLGMFDDNKGDLIPEAVQYLITGLEGVAAHRDAKVKMQGSLLSQNGAEVPANPGGSE